MSSERERLVNYLESRGFAVYAGESYETLLEAVRLDEELVEKERRKDERQGKK